jgi:hypothetical protein
MKISYLGALVLICSSTAMAVPSQFVLTTATKIIRNANGQKNHIVAMYKAPCKSLDYASVVIRIDDSGDNKAAVGVAYPMSSCVPSNTENEFRATTEITTTGVKFSPMLLQKN